MSFGVDAGAKIPIQNSTSMSGKPACAMVGRSGSATSRLPLATASPRSFPSLTCATLDAGEPKAIGVWPPMVDATAGPAPLNGTCTRSSPSDRRNSSAVMCPGVPMPGEA